ncbi:efflux RND transporter periplasmic adaptor subunit [Sorangium sp. So ce117]|uniref:efflux RND transporter periplasmic adaptor subunit n=1 Tax=Sorangium sp. So ce117 TaxID=3133277 RepID=UPI003F5DCCB0
MSSPARRSAAPPTTAPPPPGSPADDLGFDLPPPAVLTRTRGLALGVGLVVVLGAAFAAAYLPRRSARAALEQGARAAEGAAPRVGVVAPQPVSSDRALVLPGSIQPLAETVVYPRVSGYVRRWTADIGDKVDEGQILAEIDTPELDQELAQARAQLVQASAGLVQAEANRDLSRSSVKRYEQLVPAGVAPQEELEQRQGQAHVAEASVTVARAAITAQQANVQRILDQKKFAKVAAPFAGTVTSRTTERGALVTAGNGTPLFTVAATDPVRVFVGVPQDVAPSVRVDAPAKVTVREFAGQPFQGTIARTAGALDPATRTMNTEVRVPNPDGRLLTGMYAEVALTLPTPHRVLEIPATALYNDAKGLRVAVIDPGSRIRFAPIVVERDTGATIQVSTGLDGSERVVKLASAELTEGMAVEILPEGPPPPPPGGPNR